MKRVLGILVGLGLLLALVMGSVRALNSVEQATAVVSREDVQVTVQATGRLEAALAFEVGPPSVRDVWNYNLKWMVKDGSVVKKGGAVARFDTTDLDTRLRQRSAELETIIEERQKEERSLEIELQQLQLDLVKAEGDVARTSVELSVPEGLVSAITMQQFRLNKELAERTVAFLKEKATFKKRLVQSKLDLLDVKRSRVEQLMEYLNGAKAKFSVKAPIDGLVIYIQKQNGDRWEVGERVWMLAKLLKIADVTTLRVATEVLEVDAARVEVGQAASVVVDALPGMVLATEVGELGRLVRERSAQDASKIFDAYLPLPEFDAELMRPGMSVHAVLTVEVLPDRITVPLEAIHGSPDGSWVEVEAVAGEATRRRVVLGVRTGDRVVVREGLEEGETVVLGGQA